MSPLGPRRWPVSLSHGPVGLRPIRRRDAHEWFAVRARNRSWTAPWDGTRPPDNDGEAITFAQMVRTQTAISRALDAILANIDKAGDDGPAHESGRGFPV